MRRFHLATILACAAAVGCGPTAEPPPPDRPPEARRPIDPNNPALKALEGPKGRGR